MTCANKQTSMMRCHTASSDASFSCAYFAAALLLDVVLASFVFAQISIISLQVLAILLVVSILGVRGKVNNRHKRDRSA